MIKRQRKWFYIATLILYMFFPLYLTFNSSRDGLVEYVLSFLFSVVIQLPTVMLPLIAIRWLIPLNTDDITSGDARKIFTVVGCIAGGLALLLTVFLKEILLPINPMSSTDAIRYVFYPFVAVIYQCVGAATGLLVGLFLYKIFKKQKVHLLAVLAVFVPLLVVSILFQMKKETSRQEKIRSELAPTIIVANPAIRKVSYVVDESFVFDTTFTDTLRKIYKVDKFDRNGKTIVLLKHLPTGKIVRVEPTIPIGINISVVVWNEKIYLLSNNETHIILVDLSGRVILNEAALTKYRLSYVVRGRPIQLSKRPSLLAVLASTRGPFDQDLVYIFNDTGKLIYKESFGDLEWKGCRAVIDGKGKNDIFLVKTKGDSLPYSFCYSFDM
jgi:hypothetical protein